MAKTANNKEITEKIRIGKLETNTDAIKYIARCIRKAETTGNVDMYDTLCDMALKLMKGMTMGTHENLEQRIAAIEKALKGL